MADEKHEQFPRTNTTSSNDPKRDSGTYDPEFEVPDPEQVERDIEEQEDSYRDDKGKRQDPAA